MPYSKFEKKYVAVARQLRKQLENEYAPGQMFPPEVELAQSYGVSVSTIRKAMAILVDDGLLERRQGKGTTVIGTEGTVGQAAQTRKSVLVVPFDNSIFFHEEIVEIQNELFRCGYAAVMYNVPTAKAGKMRAHIREAIQTHSVCGIICGPWYRPPYEPLLEAFADLPYPVVFVKVGQPFPANYVAVDLGAGVYQAAVHLHDLGCRSIRYFGIPATGGPWSKAVGVERFLAETLPDQAFDDFTVSATGTIKSGYEVACQEFGAGRVPDGILAFNDLCAVGITMAARKFGVRIPEDLALVGIDDIAYASQYAPPLTTVRQPKRDIAREAVRILDEACADDSGQVHQQVLLQPALTLRESTMGFGRAGEAGQDAGVLATASPALESLV